MRFITTTKNHKRIHNAEPDPFQRNKELGLPTGADALAGLRKGAPEKMW